MIRIYEEYKTPQDKRRAQVGAKRGQPTGKARGYILVWDDDGFWGAGHEYCYNALGSICELEEGEAPRMIGHVTPSHGYLGEKCRRVGREHMPREWRIAFASEVLSRCRFDWYANFHVAERKFVAEVMKAYDLKWVTPEKSSAA